RLLAAPRRSGLGQGTIQGDPLVRQCGADVVRCNADGASHVSETMRLDASWEGCVRPAIRASTRCCVTLGIHRRQVQGVTSIAWVWMALPRNTHHAAAQKARNMPDSRLLPPAIPEAAMLPGAILGPLRQPIVPLRPRHHRHTSRY